MCVGVVVVVFNFHLSPQHTLSLLIAGLLSYLKVPLLVLKSPTWILVVVFINICGMLNE